MGVVGRELGVGMELVVAVLMLLPPDRREPGLGSPVPIVLLANPVGRYVGDIAVREGRIAVEAEGRKGPPVGLEARLRSLFIASSDSLGFCGEGESSMMSTHPVES